MRKLCLGELQDIKAVKAVLSTPDLLLLIFPSGPQLTPNRLQKSNLIIHQIICKLKLFFPYYYYEFIADTSINSKWGGAFSSFICDTLNFRSTILT